MIAGKRTLVVVPARGGSKGIPLKNLRTVLGRSLVARVGDVCRALDWLDRVVVSTDHEAIAAEAEAADIAAPFRRPPELSGDRIGDLEVLTHAVLESERIDGVRYDIVIMLQPTSPMRRPAHVDATVAALLDGDWDAAWTVSETDSKSHPLKQLTIESGHLGYYDPKGVAIIARQQLVPVYHRNGIAYAFSRDCLLQQKMIMGRRTRAVVLEGEFVNIDTERDIRLAEFLMRGEGTDSSRGLPNPSRGDF